LLVPKEWKTWYRILFYIKERNWKTDS
jgi:hypothetical protein